MTEAWLSVKRMLFPVMWAWSFGGIGHRTIVDRPAMVRGQRWIYLGKDVLIRYGGRIEVIRSYAGRRYGGELRIGDGTIVENNVHISCAGGIGVGRNVSIGPFVSLIDNDHSLGENGPRDGALRVGMIRIGDGVWIGAGARILKNVTIGERAIVGANAVVTHDVPAGARVAGVPARQL